MSRPTPHRRGTGRDRVWLERGGTEGTSPVSSSTSMHSAGTSHASERAADWPDRTFSANARYFREETLNPEVPMHPADSSPPRLAALVDRWRTNAALLRPTAPPGTPGCWSALQQTWKQS